MQLKKTIYNQYSFKYIILHQTHIMHKKIGILSLILSGSMIFAQPHTHKKNGLYFLIGGTYFIEAAQNQLPAVGGLSPTKETTVNNVVISKSRIKGTFGEGFRSNLLGGYRFNNRLGIEIAGHYYNSNAIIMAERQNFSTTVDYNLTVKGRLKNFDLSPSIVVYIGEKGNWEPYSRIGLIIPFYGRSEIITEQTSSNPSLAPVIYKRDVIKPDATVGFSAALGLSYKISTHFCAIAEIEYSNKI